MKTITIKKDSYTDTSVRVSYYDASAVRKERRMKSPQELTELFRAGSPLTHQEAFEEVDVNYEPMVFCERLYESEAELDAQIAIKIEELRNT